MRLHLYTHGPDGQVVSRETIELDELPETGTVLRPPICRADCFVTRAAPASLEETGDLRIAGAVYADLVASLVHTTTSLRRSTTERPGREHDASQADTSASR